MKNEKKTFKEATAAYNKLVRNGTFRSKKDTTKVRSKYLFIAGYMTRTAEIQQEEL